MSVIVASPSEGVVIADRFVLETSKAGGVPVIALTQEEKIHISSDNYFAWVFEEEQCKDLVPVVLSYIERFERGTLKDKEAQPDLKSLGEFKLVVVSKRHFYRVITDKKNPISIRKNTWANYVENFFALEPLELTAKQIFEGLVPIGGVVASHQHDVFKQSSLTLIPAKKGKKK